MRTFYREEITVNKPAAAYVTDCFAAGYIIFQDHGRCQLVNRDRDKVLGHGKVVSAWRTAPKGASKRMCLIHIIIFGREYSGRCHDLEFVHHAGPWWRGKLLKSPKVAKLVHDYKT